MCKRIVIVDDDQDDIMFLKTSMLRYNCDFEIESFDDGEDALKSLMTSSAKIPDYLFLDSFMPKLDGSELFRAIRRDSRFAKLKVIATSSNRDASRLWRPYQTLPKQSSWSAFTQMIKDFFAAEGIEMKK